MQFLLSEHGGAAVKPIALRFISEPVRMMNFGVCIISGMGGIETWRDALEFFLMGASSLQITTAVIQYGYRIIGDLLYSLTNYMKCKGISSVSKLTGAAAGVSVVIFVVLSVRFLLSAWHREGLLSQSPGGNNLNSYYIAFLIRKVGNQIQI